MPHVLADTYPFIDYAVAYSEADRIMTEMLALSAPNSPSGMNYMVKIDRNFWGNIGWRLHDYFIECFNGPFSISQLKGDKDFYLFVHPSERKYFSLKSLTRVKPVRTHK